MSHRGNPPPRRPQSWATGLRPISADGSDPGVPPPPDAPSSGGNPSNENDFRYLMGRSFIGSSLDDIVEDGPSRRRRRSSEEPPQRAVDDMLSNILQSAPESGGYPSQPPVDAPASYASPPGYGAGYRTLFDSSNYGNYQHPPPSYLPFQFDVSQPPPNFQPYAPVNPTPPPSAAPASIGNRGIERRWSNILKPNAEPKEENVATSPKPTTSTSSVASPTKTDPMSPERRSREPEPVPPERSPEPRLTSPSRGESSERDSLEPPPLKAPSLFEDIMKYELDPKRMTYCGKEFVKIVEIRSGNRALCHLCRVVLDPQELARHLDEETHHKSLQKYVIEREYKLFEDQGSTPNVARRKFLDFKAYLMDRYPHRIEEFFEKAHVTDDISGAEKSEFVLKIVPVKMRLKDTKVPVKKKPPEKKPEEKDPKERMSKCSYCEKSVKVSDLVDHSCRPMMRGMAVNVFFSEKVGVPKHMKVDPAVTAGSTYVPENVVIPPGAVDVQLKSEMCEEFAKYNHCQYGKKCMYAHDPRDVGKHTYRRVKTDMCPYLSIVGACKNEPCAYAHDQDELMVIKYKTCLCRSFIENQTCQYGNNCVFAHGMKELISPFDNEPIKEKMSSSNTSSTASSSSSSSSKDSWRNANATDRRGKEKDGPSSKKQKIKLTLKTKI